MTDEKPPVDLAVIGDLLRKTYGPRIAEQLNGEGLMSLMRLKLNPYDRSRKRHAERIPYTDEEITASRKFHKRWRKLTKKGVKLGYLYDDPYEGVGIRELTDQERYENVWDETEEEWQERVAALPEDPGFIVISRNADL